MHVYHMHMYMHICRDAHVHAYMHICHTYKSCMHAHVWSDLGQREERQWHWEDMSMCMYMIHDTCACG